MQIYQTKTNRLSGTDYREVHKKARAVYQKIARQTKRRPYVRSAYFGKQKIFLTIFWPHIYEKKNWRDKVRRMRYLPCAFELIQKSRFQPISKVNQNRKIEILYRFFGKTGNGKIFFVQIKENRKTGKKWLMSVFSK
ncbi:hypothetical protein ACFL2B_02035 [Patescibacteria group bacterium]